MWFDGWSQVLRVLAVGAVTYLSLVVLLRIAGKRTLAKLNAFDLVVTVALGSTLSAVLVNKTVAWTEGVAALLLLVGAQFVVAGLAARMPVARAVVTARPTVLVRDGALDRETLRRSRVAPAEVRQAVRGSGHGDLSRVAAVILETDGSLSVIAHDALGDGSALVDAR